jgi:hypothetical protein
MPGISEFAWTHIGNREDDRDVIEEPDVVAGQGQPGYATVR